MLTKERLKAVYNTQDKIPSLIKNVIPEQGIKGFYVKPKIIIQEEKKDGNYKDIREEKKEVKPKDIFGNSLTDLENENFANKILIVGETGAGKSTLMKHMSYKWSCGELWHDKFDYVYRISLKTLLDTNWRSTPWPYSLEDLRENLLRCLVHYNLTKDFTSYERERLKPEHIPWSTDERTLLLIDGYEEIAHLRGDPRSDYKIIFDNIFRHKKLILASRPNAIRNDTKKFFDRIVENTGFDNHGIDRYIKLYFKDDNEKRRQLETLLSDNREIKNMAQIPVLIATLCWIWSDQDSNRNFPCPSYKSNLYILYQMMKDILVKRFYVHKKWTGANLEGTGLFQRLQNGCIDLDEIHVLSHAAYKSQTIGGIGTPEKGRVEKPLVIKGVQDKEGRKDLKDTQGTAFQSSINYQSERGIIQNDIAMRVTIGDVHMVGFTKVVGTNTNISAVNREPSETDLQRQNYIFINSTFREFLAACYLISLLKNGNDQEKNQVYQFIAEHRNKPRYLMTLKFMAGAVTAEQGETEKDNEIVRMFWDAIICNVDGMIELGIDTKIILVMNLLGQSNRGQELDSRIPNKEKVVNFIDFVVLDNLLNWGIQLKESGYMSENIREGLTRAICEQSLKWHAEKVFQIYQTFSSELKFAADCVKKNKTNEQDRRLKGSEFVRVLEMTENLFAEPHQCEILAKLKHIILQDSKKYEWEIVKQTIQGVTKFASQNKITLEENGPLVDKLIQLFFDSNLKQSCLDALCSIIRTGQTTATKMRSYDLAYEQWKPNIHSGSILCLTQLAIATEDSKIFKKFVGQVKDLLTSGIAGASEAFLMLSKIPNYNYLLMGPLINILTKNDLNYHSVPEFNLLVFTAEKIRVLAQIFEQFAGLIRHDHQYLMMYVRTIIGVARSGVKSKQVFDKQVFDKSIAELTLLLANDDWKIRTISRKALINLVQETKDKYIFEKVHEQLLKILMNTKANIVGCAIKVIVDVVDVVQTREEEPKIITKTIEQVTRLLANKNDVIKLYALMALRKLAQPVIKNHKIVDMTLAEVTKLFYLRDSSLNESFEISLNYYLSLPESG